MKNKLCLKNIIKYIAIFVTMVFLGLFYKNAQMTDAGTSTIPDAAEKLASYAGTTLTIQNYEDWINLQKLSKTTTLEGYEVVVNTYNGGNWHLENEAEFTGLGSEEFPFSGTIHMYQSGLTIYTKYPLFDYLSVNAHVYNISINAVKSTSGLADNLAGVPEETEDENAIIELKDISVEGTVENENGAAGGLFGKISGKSIVKMSCDGSYYSGVSIKCSVKGKTAGGVVGIMTKNTEIIVNGMLKAVPNSVTSTLSAAGEIAGTSNAGKIIFDTINDNSGTELKEIVLNVKSVSGKGNIGGIVGDATDNSIVEAKNIEKLSLVGTYDAGTIVPANITNTVSASEFAGGIFGNAKNSSIITNDTDVIISGFAVSSAATNAGGLAGISEDLIISGNKNLVISQCAVISKGGAAGGLSGKDIVTGANTKSNILVQNVFVSSTKAAGGVFGYVDNQGRAAYSNLTINGLVLQGAGGVGGVAGIISGNSTDIHDVIVNIKNVEDTSAINQNASYTDSSTYDGVIGGIVGNLKADIKVKNAVLRDSSDESAQVDKINLDLDGEVGGVIGRISKSTDSDSQRVVQLEGIYVQGKESSSKTNKYSGGVVGLVENNCAVRLSGTIDTSKTTVATNYQYCGLIVGCQNQALIYQENDAAIITSATKEDKVGNYGGIFINQADNDKSLINIDENGKISITHKVAFSDGKYQINSLNDITALAIALNTEENFALDAFRQNDTAVTKNQLLASDYTLNIASIDFAQSGIYSLNRNDAKGLTQHFTGSMTSSMADGTVISNSLVLYSQGYIGLFPATGDGAAYSNLKINSEYTFGDSAAIGNAGGISAQAVGKIDISDVNAAVTIKEVSNSLNNCNGGIFGKYTVKADKTLNLTNLNINASITHKSFTHIAGGVIGYVNNSNDGTGVIKVKNCNISGNITSDVNGIADVDGKKYERTADIGMFIADISQNMQEAYANTYGTSKHLELDVDGLDLDNVSVITKAAISGGMLGNVWSDGEFSLKNINVNNSSLDVKGCFGGMINAGYGKLTVDNLSINSVSFVQGEITSTIYNAENSYAGLIVGDGRYLYLSINDYLTNAVTANLVSENADEIVGINIGNKSGDNKNGGITTISGKTNGNPNGKPYLETSSEYFSYENTILSGRKNKFTRYYYDIDSSFANSKTGDFATTTSDIAAGKINSEADLMMWHLAQYANAGLKTYFYSGTIDTVNSIEIKGMLDMTGYSIYPTDVSGLTVTGSENAGIIFDAQNIDDNENAKLNKRPYDSERQHFRIHAGLFGNAAGINVTGLSLKGTAAAYTLDGVGHSGALVSGNLSGKCNIKDVVCDNLWIANPNGTTNQAAWSGYYGLLISGISANSTIGMDGISMTGYTDDDANAKKYAASALIGIVGGDGDTETDIHLTFINMDIADAADGKSSASLNNSKADEVMAYASFIYYYNYYSSSNGLYTFMYDDFVYGTNNKTNTGAYKITNGAELWDEGVMSIYYYDKEHNSMLVGTGDDIADSYKAAYQSDCYKPYVYTKQKIDVNPKSGDVNVGCGTYEDPYIITSADQFMAIYWYLNDSENNVTNLDGWTINKPKDDKAICDGNEITVAFDAEKGDFVYNNSKLNIKSQLRNAYYMIKGTIDLSKSAYASFRGLGTVDDPFTGVIIGDGNSVIDLTVQSESVTVSAYGLIQYAKGAVVQNLTVNIQENSNIIVSQYGAGAIGCVLGGDNIISDVSIEGCMMPADVSSCIGGYVGEIQLGCVILRDVNENNFKDFYVKYDDTHSSKEGEDLNYLYSCGILGRVKDGFAVYEKSGNTTDELVDLTGKYSNNLNSSRSFSILNGDYIDGSNKIQVEYDSTGKKMNYALNGTGDLMITALAMNSGVLNYDGTNTTGSGVGYNKIARCRNNDYSYVGNNEINDSSSDAYSAYQKVIKEDNMNGGQLNGKEAYQPYLLKYFDLSLAGNYLGSNNLVSILNSYDLSVGQNFELVNATYDMAPFGNAFRGIGGRYYTSSNRNIFHGSFNGNNSEIKLNMIGDNVQAVSDVALFNRIESTNTSKSRSIENIIISGNIVNCNDASVGSGASQNVRVSDELFNDKSAAGIVSYLKGTYTFKNVELTDIYIESQEYTAGIVARSDTVSKLTFEECQITKGNVKNKICAQADAGSLGGYIQSGYDMTISNCNIDYTEIVSKNVNLRPGATTTTANDYYVAGGLIARLNGGKNLGINGECIISDSLIEAQGVGGALVSYDNFKTTIDAVIDISGLNIIVHGRPVNAGGLIGYTNRQLIINKKISLDKMSINSDGNESYTETAGTDVCIGGIVGYYQSGDELKATDVKLGNRDGDGYVQLITGTSGSKQSNIGGIAGRANGRITVSNFEFYGSKNESGEYSSKIYCSAACGALVGNTSSTITVKENLKVSGVDFTSRHAIGGIVGYTSTGAQIKLNDSNKADSVTEITDCRFRFTGAEKEAAVGGIVGKCDGGILVIKQQCVLKNIEMYGGNISFSGGIVGLFRNGSLNIELAGKNNCIEGNTFVGGTTGGIIGGITKTGNVQVTCSDLSIKNNKIISSYVNEQPDKDLTNNKGITCSKQNPSKEFAAGGLIGYTVSGANININAKSIGLENNFIAAIHMAKNDIIATNEITAERICYAGGLFGYRDASTTGKSYLNNIYMKDNYVGILEYATIPEQECTLYSDIISYYTNQVAKENTYPINKKETYLVNTDMNVLKDSLKIYDKTQNQYVEIPDNISEEELYRYAKYTGNVAGYLGEKRHSTSIINFNVDNRNIGNKYWLPSDIGMDVTSTEKIYKAYRPYWYIVYGDYKQNGGGDNDASVNNDVIPEAIKNVYGTDNYQFASVKNILDDYNSESISKSRAYKLSENYGQTFTSTFNEVYGNTYYNATDGYLSVLKDAGGNTIPAIEYKAEYGTPDEILNAYINILTNNGGAVNTGDGTVIKSVETKQMSVTLNSGTTSVEMTTNTPAISAEKNGDLYAFAQQGSDKFDVSTGGTFTLIHISYYDGKNTSDIMTLDIPVFVEPKLKVTTHMRMLKGKQFDVENIEKNGEYVTYADIANGTDTAVTMPQSDIYTVYGDYVYSEVRSAYDSACIDKKLYLQKANSTSAMELPVGIRFSLVDITNKNRVFYYTVQTSGVSEINFTDFKDKAGNGYVTQDVSDTTNYPVIADYKDICGDDNINVGVEKFVIVIDPSGISASDMTLQALYYVKITSEQMKNTNASLWKRMDYSNHCCCKLSGVTDTTATFDRTTDEATQTKYTQASGSISASDKLTVNTKFDVSAAAAYWNEIKNSSTTDYMDVEFYIEKDGARINLPVGTKITINDQTIYSFSGESEIYYFKDSNSSCSMKHLAEIASTATSIATVNTEMVLEFPADMGDFEAGNYVVYAKLLNCSDKEFPGSGEIRDTWSESVSSQVDDKLSFAVNVNDIKKLGMNAYLPESTDDGIVDFTLRYQFPSYLIKNTTKAEKDLEEYATCNYVVQYVIQKKNSAGEYETYTGDSVKFYDGSSDALPDDSQDVKTYNFTKQQIFDSVKNETPLEEKACMTVDTQALTLNNDTITNYRVVAVLNIMDEENLQSKFTESDYYVFTVAKLKTDLD